VFRHVCGMGSKASCRSGRMRRTSGPSKAWLKSKNPASEAVRREREEDWNAGRGVKRIQPHCGSFDTCPQNPSYVSAPLILGGQPKQ
jgi:hypothetical protein